MPQDSVINPGDSGVGQGAKAHREAMEELNPYKPPVTGTPPTGYEDKGTAKGSARIPKGEKRIPDAELADMTKKLGAGSVKDKGGKISVIGGTNIPVKDKGGKVDVMDGKHTLAILKDGERVLTPEQNKKFEKTAAGAAAKEEPTKITAKTAAGKSPVQECDMDCYDEGGTVHSPEEKAHFHRAMSHLNTGGLHRHLGIDESKPIPLSKKKEAANSDNPHVAAMGRMAVAMHGWKHPGKK